MIDRRQLLLASLGTALVSHRSMAQSPGRVYRLAVLSPSQESTDEIRSLVIPELVKMGFAEPRNLAVTLHVGPQAKLPALARDALATNPDVIIAQTNSSVRAILQISKTVPIVMAFAGEDPVATGLAHSLARPGGSVTGLTNQTTQLDGKRMALLHEAVPAARRIAFLAVAPPRHVDSIKEVQRVAGLLGVDITVFHADAPEAYAAVFAAMRAGGMQAVAYAGAPEFVRDGELLGRLAIASGLASIGEAVSMATNGGLIGYGPDRIIFRKRAADFVARILRGTLPGEIPIEQPTHYVFALNLKTAKALGLTLPQSILVQATEVIE
jgi:putative tryptophan/tyrosine transport system substrate-binding protein